MNNTANNLTLSVIIPAYNEAERIETTLESIRGYFKTKDISYEIIVVDDGSDDGTVEVVRAHMKKLPAIRILEYGANRGKGYAVNHGMRYAEGQYRLFMDADNSVDISHLDAFLKEVRNGHDIAIGSIRLPNSAVLEENGHHRRMLGALSKYLISLFTGLSIADTQRGFKLFSKRAAETVFSRQTIERFGFDIELLVIAKENAMKIKELPVKWINPSGSKVTLKSYFETLRELLSIMRNRLAGKYTSASFGGRELAYERKRVLDRSIHNIKT